MNNEFNLPCPTTSNPGRRRRSNIWPRASSTICVAEGYRVTTVGDGPSALKILEENPGRRRSGDSRSDVAGHERLCGVRGDPRDRHGHAHVDSDRPHAHRRPHPGLRRRRQPVSHQALRSGRIPRPGEELADFPRPRQAARAIAGRIVANSSSPTRRSISRPSR